MEWLKTILSVIVSFFIITLLFATVNGLELFSWEIMEKNLAILFTQCYRFRQPAVSAVKFCGPAAEYSLPSAP